MNTKDILDYLKVALDMETDLFMTREFLNKIRQVMSGLGHSKTINGPKKPVQEENNISLGDGCGSVAALIGGLVVGGFLVFGIITDGWSKKWLFLAVPAFLFALLALGALISDPISNSRKFNKEWKEYQGKLEIYHKEVNDDSKRVQEETRQIEELKRVETNVLRYMEGATQRLKQYYMAGILHPKYQNFIAVSSIYEYLDTGICDRLVGMGGAYDTFETLSRMDKIITSIDDVKDLLYNINGSLQEIKGNQFVLYQAIESSNRRLDEFSSDLTNRLSVLSSQNQQGIDQLKISNYLALKENTEMKEMQNELKRIREIQAGMES